MERGKEMTRKPWPTVASIGETLGDVRNGEMLIFAAPASKNIAKRICEHLEISLGKIQWTQFSDGEWKLKFMENVRGKDLYLICSTTSSDSWMHLWMMMDAARRASARRVTAVIPYLGYARQDRKDESRVPISASMVSQITEFMGARGILTMNLHADATQGSIRIPFDHLWGHRPLIQQVILDGLLGNVPSDISAMSPDFGAIKLVKRNREPTWRIAV